MNAWQRGVVMGIVGFGIMVGGSLPAVARQHNPPVVQEPAWDSPVTRELVVRACYDCHSNETHWPWYAKTTPAAWLIVHDVEEGRRAVNFSEWNRYSEEGEELVEVVQEGEMPPWFYLPLHPSAQLSAAEQQQLLAGLANLGGGGEEDEDEHEDEHEEHEHHN